MTVRHDEVLRISQNISLPKGKSYGAKCWFFVNVLISIESIVFFVQLT